MMIGYAVWNAAIEQFIAVFATEEAANAYAEGFPQCSVVITNVPDDLWTWDI